jgi:hypothetical protein
MKKHQLCPMSCSITLPCFRCNPALTSANRT